MPPAPGGATISYGPSFVPLAKAISNFRFEISNPSPVLLSRPGSFKKPKPIAMHDGCDVRLSVSSLAQQVGDFLQIDDGVQIARALLGPVSAIQVTADGRVGAVPSELADMVDMIDHGLEGDHCIGRLSRHPAGIKHPGVADGA